MFNCKLNKTYWQALKEKKKEVSLKTIAKHFGYPSVKEMLAESEDQDSWMEEYKYDTDEYDDDYYNDESYIRCCGISELNFENIIGSITRNTKGTRHMIAKFIKKTVNQGDHRILIVGLPIGTADGHNSDYDFPKYRVLLRILLGFGFKKLHQKTYVNENSNNNLYVLAGQL